MVLITGGVKSGKSSYALKLSDKFNKPKLFIATATASDEEMRRKIKRHQDERGSGWNLFEEPVKIYNAFNEIADLYLLDCLTLWVSNLIYYDEDVEENFDKFIKSIKKNTIIVTNEVGLGIIPDNELSRKYLNLLGDINKRIAQIADDVFMMISGIPVKIK